MFSTKLTLAVALLALAACSAEKHPAPTAAPAPIVVSAIAATEMDWPETFEAPGTVRATTSATLSSRVMGYVQEVRASEGDRVTAGQTLITIGARELDTAHLQAQAAAAEARSAIPESESAIASATTQLQLAESTHRRMEELFQKKSISPQERDESAARVQVARSAVEMARARRRQLDEKIRQAEQAVASAQVQQSYREVMAPFSGIVTSRKAEPGILAAPGAPLLELEREGAYRLEAAVPEGHLAKVRRGQSVQVQLESGSPAFTGYVEEIVPVIEPATRSFLVKISLPARASIRGGLFGRAIFASGTHRVLALPQKAVLEQGQLRTAFAIDNGVAHARMLRLGELREGNYEVLSGLAPGDRVVSPIPAGLRDGVRVQEATR